MEAKLFMEEKARMCQSYNSGCKGCPAINVGCNAIAFSSTKPSPNFKIIEIVEKWSKEHPRKTFLIDFKEKHPNAPLNEDGIPEDICPSELGYCKSAEGCDLRCTACWNRYMEFGYENQS